MWGSGAQLERLSREISVDVNELMAVVPNAMLPVSPTKVFEMWGTISDCLAAAQTYACVYTYSVPGAHGDI